MNWRDMPPLAALRAFAAFAETGNVQKAGAALNVSHAAISQQLRALEKHLDVALLDRSGRALVLTEQGTHLAHALELGFGAIATAVQELTQADADRPLQVTVTPAFAGNWLLPRLADFRRRHPGIDLMLNPTSEVVALAAGGIDVAVRFGAGDWPGLAVEPLMPTHMVVVAAPSLVGAGQITDPAQLLDLPWLQQIGTSEAADWLERHGVAGTLRGGMVHMPGDMVLQAARAGQGVVVTTDTSVGRDIASGRLRLLFRDSDELGYHIVTRPGPLRPVARTFIAWLRRQAAQD